MMLIGSGFFVWLAVCVVGFATTSLSVPTGYCTIGCRGNNVACPSTATTARPAGSRPALNYACVASYLDVNAYGIIN